MKNAETPEEIKKVIVSMNKRLSIVFNFMKKEDISPEKLKQGKRLYLTIDSMCHLYYLKLINAYSHSGSLQNGGIYNSYRFLNVYKPNPKKIATITNGKSELGDSRIKGIVDQLNKLKKKKK